MAQAEVDTRNLEWKDNNVGSKLLQKMGWKDGQSIGRRRFLKSESDVSSEGLRVKRRAAGLGLGASSQAAAQASISHASDFAGVLQALQEEHVDESDTSKKRKKKKSKTAIVSMPTNKSTHAKVRQAKFQERTSEDMKCIFAGADVFAALSSEANNTKKKRKGDDPEKVDKKKKKKSKNKAKQGIRSKELRAA